MHFRKPSPGGVIAAVALFFALGGTAIAAHRYLITSTAQIKPAVLRKLTGRPGPQGPAGPSGATGATGPVGPAGPSNLSELIEVKGPKNPVPAKKVASSVATCPAGTHVVGGGENTFAGGVEGLASEAERPGSWFVVVANGSEFEGGWVEAIAYCANAGQAVAASRPRVGHPAAAKALATLEAQLQRRLQATSR